MSQDEDGRFSILGEVFNYSGEDEWVQLGVEGMDDAALIRYSANQSLIMASDFVRGSGFDMFKSGHMNYFDVGYYLMAANVSDIAAMGGKPICATTNLRYTHAMTNQLFHNAIQGMRCAGDTFGIKIVGGDIGSYQSDVFSATVLGIVDTDKALLRRGANPADLLCVTGMVGGAVSATAYFLRSEPGRLKLGDDAREQLLNCWRRPAPQLKAGSLLSTHRLATACMDISDGLRSSVEVLSQASNVGFEVFAKDLPLHAESSLIADNLGIDLYHLVMSASVDFQLLFTIAPDSEPLVSSVFEQNAIPWSVIGRATDTLENRMILRNSSSVPLPGIRWNQQPNLLEEILGKPFD